MRRNAAKAGVLRAVYGRLYAAHGPQSWWPADSPLEVVVGAILTQNTAWTNVEKAIRSLKSRKLLSMPRLAAVPVRELARAVRSAGFFNVKAERIKAFVGHVAARHGGRLQRLFAQDAEALRAELLSVHGIGPETADSIVLYAAGKPSFVIDAYTRRIFQRMGLADPDASYDDLRRLFQTQLRKDTRLYNEYHALIVRHAKEVCRTKPRCQACCLSGECPKKLS